MRSLTCKFRYKQLFYVIRRVLGAESSHHFLDNGYVFASKKENPVRYETFVNELDNCYCVSIRFLF